MPARPSRSRLLFSQESLTSPAEPSSAPPNTCGCRRTNFSCTPRAMSSNPSWPFSARRRARKYTWKSRSPSSSASFGSSPPIAASATSYASSTVCGTIVRAVCSRSQGQSRLNRLVSSCSSSRAAASASANGSGLLGGGRRGAGRRRRRVTGLVRNLAVEVLLQLVRPVRHRLVALLLELGLLDRRLDLRERRRLGLLDRPERFDDVVAERGLHRARDLARRQQERGLVERTDGLALRDR